MTMRRTTSISALIIICVYLFAACHGGGDRDQTPAVDTTEMLTVDRLLANPEEYVGKRVTVIGDVDHFGIYEGRRMFMRCDDNDSLHLRCDATAAIGGNFNQDIVGRRIIIKGLLQERRIDEAYIDRLTQSFMAHHEQLDQKQAETQASLPDYLVETATDKTVYGGLTKTRNPDSMFAQTIEEYRRQIAARRALDGKDYISAYYVDVIETLNAQ